MIALAAGLLPVACIAAIDGTTADTGGNGTTFSDMPGNWAKEALESAVANGLLTGYDGRIMPDSPLTRAQMAAIITRAFGETEEGDISAYTDVKSTDWFAGSMAKAYKMGVMQGSNGKMEPNKNITREQAFAILARALKLEPAASTGKSFDDENKISDWARGEVFALVNAGYIQGSNGRLDPLSYITRAEFAQVMHNIFRQYINKAGVYTELADGNIMVNVPGVTLKNVTVNGDLIVGDGVGEGELVLDNVTIKGRLLVRGGGVNSIVIKGGSVEGEVVIAKADGDIRICVENGAKVDVIVIVDGNGVVIIEGNVGTVIVKAPNVKVIIRNASVSRLEVDCDGAADIKVEKSGKVSNVVVGSEAGGSTINVEGHVANIETSAPGTAISGTGTVGAVTVNEGADNTSVTTPNTVITNKGANNVTAGGGKSVPKYGSVTNNHNGSDILYPNTGTQNTGSGPVYTALESVSVTGNALVGETLTASTTPAGAAVVYQWQKSDSENGTYTDIVGATGNTYVLDDGDAGKWIRVKATGTGYYTGTAISEPHKINGWVIAVSVTGNALVGETLTASTTPAGAAVVYQWQKSDSTEGIYTDITGATSKSYVPAAEDAGNWIRVKVTGTGNYIGTVTSAAFGPIRSPYETALTMSADDAAVIIGEQFTINVTVRGNVAYEDRNNMVRFYGVIPDFTVSDIELMTIPGGDNPEIVTDETERSHAGADADDLVLAWGPAGGTALSVIDISNTSPASLAFTAAISIAENHAITFVAYDITGQKQLNSINETATITVIDLQSLTIGGIAEVGETLTASGIIPADAPITYQWLRNGTPIDGADSKTYTITVADTGRRLSVTATYGTGSRTGGPIDLVNMGDGSPGNPYAVATAEQLDTLVRKNPNKCYIQIADIDLSGEDNWIPLPPFSGRYDGNGYVISNLKIDLTDEYAGLFSELNGGTLKNINLRDVDIKGIYYVGGLVGYVNSSTIEDCCVSGRVSGYTGVGGLVGTLGVGCTIMRSYAICNVSGTGSNIGGLAGNSNYDLASIVQSYATGSVYGNLRVGGLMGRLEKGYIINSFATGSVSGSNNVGGLVGHNTYGCISYCYAIGEVISSDSGNMNTGGLLGYGSDDRVTYSYYYLSSLPGYNNNNGKGLPRTSDQMKQGTADSEINGEKIYIDWNKDIWDFGSDDDYPVLMDMPQNRDASVFISGNPEVGEMLTVKGTIPSNAVYQWLRNDTPVSGATGKTYTLTDADIGRRISVTVSDGTMVRTSERTRLVSKGDGSAGNPYAVATSAQLNTVVRNNTDWHYVQVEDIDLSGYNWLPIKGIFYGEYDGNGFKISNLTIDRPETDKVALFTETYSSTMKNIKLEDVDIKGKDIVSALVSIHGGIISNSWVTGKVSGKTYVGGLTGINYETIVSSYAVCEVSGVSYVGGLSGCNYSIIENSYTDCEVSGNSYIGGLAGANSVYTWSSSIGTIRYCYSIGTVTGDSYTGGLVGANDTIVTASYYNSETSGQSDTGKGEPRTTEQMKRGTADSEIEGYPIYTGWDPAVWDFGDETDYPVLR